MLLSLDEKYGELHDSAIQLAERIERLEKEGLTEDQIIAQIDTFPELSALRANIKEIADLNVSLQLVPDHPYPELDPEGVATLYYLQNRQFALGKIARFAIEVGGPVLIGLSNPLLAVFLGAGLAFDKESSAWKRVGARKLLEESGVDITNIDEIEAYINNNMDHIVENEREAIIKGMESALDSIMSSTIGVAGLKYTSFAITALAYEDSYGR